MLSARCPGALEEGSELREHWDVLLSLVVILCAVMGVTIVGPPTVFTLMAQSMDCDPVDLELVLPSSMMVAWLVATPLHGALVDVFGAAGAVRLGALLASICAALYPLATGTRTLQVLHIVLGASLALCGVFALLVVLNDWFSARRGLAAAVLVSGFSIAGAAWPPTIAFVAGLWNDSWRAGMWAAAAVMVLGALPLAEWVHRRAAAFPARPSSVQGSPGPRLRRRSSEENIRGVLQPWAPEGGILVALCSRDGLALALMHFALGYLILSVMATLNTFLQRSAEFSLQQASACQALTLACSLLGKVLCGLGLDGTLSAAVGTAFFVLLSAGCACLLELAACGESQWLLAFALSYGLGFGGAFAVLAHLPGRLFGTHPAFAQVQATMAASYIVGGIAGVFTTPLLVQHLGGSYTVSFAVYLSLALACLVAQLTIVTAGSAAGCCWGHGPHLGLAAPAKFALWGRRGQVPELEA